MKNMPQAFRYVKLNIPGIDKLLPKGVPEGELILLSGSCGMGKTIFGLQYLYLAEEPGLYVSFEEKIEELKNQALAFGWDFDRLEKENKVRMIKYDPFRLMDVFELIENNIREIRAKRVVIDSISAFSLHIRSEAEVRRSLLELSEILKKNLCTSILICESVPGSNSISRFGVEEFVTDGVIVLRRVYQFDAFRTALAIWKMRGTVHSTRFHFYEITDKGIVVFPDRIVDMDRAKIFW